MYKFPFTATGSEYYNVLRQCVRCLHKNYYEVLNLKPECSDQDIRDSFIKLSKENHPDTSKTAITPKSTVNFQKIMEAYRVLSKPDTRKNYDAHLALKPFSSQPGYSSDAFHKYNYKRYANQNPESYYGIDGMNKLPNSRILWAILLFTITGIIVQAFAIRKSFTFKRQQLDETSIKAGKTHSSIRADAEQFGNTQQLIRIEERMKRDS